MNLVWTPLAWDDYLGWQRESIETTAKINELIKEIRRTPFTGTGKPEPLRGEYAGWWSRRITAEHRLIYRVEGKKGDDQRLIIVQCRYHY